MSFEHVTIEVGESVSPEKLVSGRLVFDTAGRGFSDLMRPVDEFLRGIKAGTGLLTFFVRHTSASLTIQENTDPDVLDDLLSALEALAPRGATWRHRLEGADDMPAHVKTMLSDVSVTVPVAVGRLSLGTWQTIYLIEHRDVSHRREVSLHYIGS